MQAVRMCTLGGGATIADTQHASALAKVRLHLPLVIPWYDTMVVCKLTLCIVFAYSQCSCALSLFLLLTSALTRTKYIFLTYFATYSPLVARAAAERISQAPSSQLCNIKAVYPHVPIACLQIRLPRLSTYVSLLVLFDSYLSDIIFLIFFRVIIVISY